MKEINEDDNIRVLGGSEWNANKQNDNKRNRRLKRMVIISVAAIAVCIGLYIYMDHRFYGFEYPLSRQQEDVITALNNTRTAKNSGIVFDEDSCLGVKLKLYKISGLKARLQDSLPSTADNNIYLITRSSDYSFENDEVKIIGDYVSCGNIISKSNWRAGYFAILKGNAEIGIGRRPEMRSFIIDNKGSMFRQFALVSAGIKCTSQYLLKGKVTRCAYARTADNELYFIETVNPETLYGFSDALVEFGFIDAVYVTGGTQPDLFYRDSDGTSHGRYVDDKSHKMVVWTKY